MSIPPDPFAQLRECIESIEGALASEMLEAFTKVRTKIARTASDNDRLSRSQADAIVNAALVIDSLETTVVDMRTSLDQAQLQLAQTEEKANRLARSQAEALVHSAEVIDELETTQEHLKKAKADAEVATVAKSAFLANMSHEIRTPLTAILGFAETMRDNVEQPENTESIEVIVRNGDHLLRLINDILDLSKLEANRLEIEAIQCSPAEIVSDVLSMMRVRADQRGLNLSVDYASPLPEAILSDPTRLRQVLLNLVGNAIKFTEQGSVTIRVLLKDATTDSPHLCFDVVDTGIGMTPEQQSKLFQPFSQADASTTRKFGGTGLGLTISQRLVLAMGGHIEQVSEAGVGTTFSFDIATGRLDYVPLVELSGEAMLDAPAAANPEAALPVVSGRVLLADDGPDNRRLISFILKKAGAMVVTVENGQEAVDAAIAAKESGSPFDVILMDMQMPLLDGYGATRQLRDRGYTRPIIALTAHAMAEAKRKCAEAGCDDFATKPIDRRRLLTIIAAWQRRTADQPTQSGKKMA